VDADQIALGTVQNGYDQLKLNYTYNTTGNADNNGNVLTQQITVTHPGSSNLVFDQAYTYDSLNRLQSAEEKTDATTNWKQTYTFDRYGNRNFDEANTTTLTKNCGTSPNFTVCTADVPKENPVPITSTNKLTGYTYDAAGNVTTDAEGRTFTYDAENKQIEVKNSSNVTLGTYYFDGDGKRVKKVVPSTGELTVFVYAADSKMVAEYSTNVVPAQDAKVQYLTNDNLGTPRINLDANSTVTARHDYMPYGEELVALGGRSSAEKYVADDVRQGFTGYIDDEETGLDFAEARMYANTIGRFMGVDTGAFTPADPQNFNRYIYVQNSPIKYKDPTGKDLSLSGDGAEDFLEFLRSKSGLDLERDAKTGKITIKKGSKRNEDGTSKSFAKLLQNVLGGSEKLSYEVVKNDTTGSTL
jgi:RHS repeat-associated protein